MWKSSQSKRPEKSAAIILFLLTSFLLGCYDYIDEGRTDRIIYFYIKGHLVNVNTGEHVSGMKVLLESTDTDRLMSADSTSLNGSYVVYQYYNTDPHAPRLSYSHIIASNSEFFGDTLITEYSIDTLKLDIMVKSVGKILLNFHNLDNVSKVIVSTIDTALLRGYIRNLSVIEFVPLNSDTSFTLPAFPDRQNGVYVWFNKYIPGGSVFDSVFYIKSGDSVNFTIKN